MVERRSGFKSKKRSVPEDAVIVRYGTQTKSADMDSAVTVHALTRFEMSGA